MRKPLLISSWAVVAVLVCGLEAKASGTAIHPEREGKSPSLTADARGQLHLAYISFESSKDVPDIFYMSSKDGKSWGTPVDVSKTDGVSTEPELAVGSAGEIVIVWDEASTTSATSDIYAVSSTNGGKTWSKPVNVSNTPGKSTEPSIAIAPDGSFHVVWHDVSSGDQQDIWYSASHDHGKTWSKAVDVSNTPGVSAAPEVACGPRGDIEVTWADNSDGQNQDVWLASSPDGGKSWAQAKDISNTPGLSANPAIAVDGGGVIYVAWDEAATGADHPDVFLSISRDGAKTFEKAVDISKTPGTSSNPELSAGADGQVGLVWEDTGKDAKAPDIWVTSSSDAGKTFAAGTNLSNSPGLSSAADVTLVYGTAYAVWEEDVGGKSELMTASVPLK